MERNRNILTEGLMLTLRNWPAFVWTYIFNLGISILFSIPLHAQLVAVTAHSLASQRLTGAFDLGTVVGVFSKLAKGPGPATSPSLFSTPIYVAIAFLLLPGTLLGSDGGAYRTVQVVACWTRLFLPFFTHNAYQRLNHWSHACRDDQAAKALGRAC